MTDIEYIVAFRDNNQRNMRHFYNRHRDAFFRDIGSYYRILNKDLLAEIFQEANVRLWKNILNGKLSETNLTTSLAGYLFSIGRLVAKEIFRREGISITNNADENKISEQTSDVDADNWLARETEQEVAVRRAVYAMGEPCAPLLLLFYWDDRSWEDIAVQLHYKDANSAKSQKYKCMQKLKAQFL